MFHERLQNRVIHTHFPHCSLGINGMHDGKIDLVIGSKKNLVFSGGGIFAPNDSNENTEL